MRRKSTTPGTLHGFLVLDFAPHTDHVGIGLFSVPVPAFQKNSFHEGREAFMNPPIRWIRGTYRISPPFVAALVHQNKIKAPFVVTKPVSIGHSALMFHAQIGTLNHFVSVLPKGVGAQCFFVTTHHINRLSHV